MNEQTANTVAKAMRGETWQSGGGIWLVILRREDGHLVVISDDAVNEYENEEAFEHSEALNYITLR